MRAQQNKRQIWLTVFLRRRCRESVGIEKAHDTLPNPSPTPKPPPHLQIQSVVNPSTLLEDNTWEEWTDPQPGKVHADGEHDVDPEPKIERDARKEMGE